MCIPAHQENKLGWRGLWNKSEMQTAPCCFLPHFPLGGCGTPAAATSNKVDESLSRPRQTASFLSGKVTKVSRSLLDIKRPEDDEQAGKIHGG